MLSNHETLVYLLFFYFVLFCVSVRYNSPPKFKAHLLECSFFNAETIRLKCVAGIFLFFIFISVYRWDIYLYITDAHKLIKLVGVVHYASYYVIHRHVLNRGVRGGIIKLLSEEKDPV